jgi:type IV pilus assembly protein PilE
MSRDFLRRGAPMRRKGPGGFTLLEILITAVLLGILAAIAIPSYSAYIARGQRAAAKAALMQSAQFLERNYTAYGCYDKTSAPCASASAVTTTLPSSNAPTDGGQFTYAVSLTAVTSQTYTLIATPCGTAGTCPAGSNSAFTDPQCGTLALDYTGTKTASGGTSTDTPTCWGR